MANQSDLTLRNHYTSLITAAEHFANSPKAKFFKDAQTGEVISWQNAYKELYGLLPKYKNPDPVEFFQQVNANKDSDPLIKQYLMPHIEEESGVKNQEPEEKKPESKDKKKEDEEPKKIFKDSYQKKEEEASVNSSLDDSKTSLPDNSLNEQTSNENPAEPQPESVILPEQPVSSSLDNSLTSNESLENKEQVNENPANEELGNKETRNEQPAPKIDLKPLPTPIFNPSPNQKPAEAKRNQPQSINPTIPTANRSEQKAEKPVQPNIQNTQDQKPTETPPQVIRKPSFFQRIKQAIFAVAASETAQSVTKEASFQAQMGIKKGVDKGTQVVGSFAKGGLEAAGNLFKGNPETYYVDTPEIDNTYPDQDPNIYYGRGGQKPAYFRGQQKSPSGGLTKQSIWKSPLARGLMIGGLLLFIYTFFIDPMQDDIAPLMAQVFNETGNISHTPATTGLGGVAFCDFTYRGKSVAIKSERLKNLFEEVSGLTGVPASVLASVAVHESPVFTLQADDLHDAFANTGLSGTDCLPHFPTSPTGALGLMQIQAPANLKPQNAPNYNPNAYSKEGVEIGLKFLNRSLNSLTTRDFCDLRTNIILGAGVLIAKNGGTPPTTGSEVKEAVCRYYGQCEYGIYNYGDEVQGDFENCQAPSSSQLVANGQNSFCPIPNGVITCGSQATPINSCGHCGLNYGENMSICASFPATKFAMDIAASPRQAVILPTLSGKSMRWEWKFEESKGVDAIQGYVGTDLSSGSKYLLQLHHTQTGSGKKGISFSGEQGGVICTNCNHLHIQLGEGSTLGNTNWIDTPRYFCQTQSNQIKL